MKPLIEQMIYKFQDLTKNETDWGITLKIDRQTNILFVKMNLFYN